MLVLAIHSVAEISAKVPFACMVLTSLIQEKAVPEAFKCRMVSPIIPISRVRWRGLSRTTTHNTHNSLSLSSYLSRLTGPADVWAVECIRLGVFGCGTPRGMA